MPTNYALSSNGASVSLTGGSVTSNGGSGAAAVIDGSRNTQTSGEYTGYLGDALTINFGQEREINQVVLYSQSGYTASDETATITTYGLKSARLEAFTGGAWVVLNEYSGNNRVLKRVFFDTIITSKIRVTILAGGDNYGKLTEAEAYYDPLINYALASNGGTAAQNNQYSSDFPTANGIDGLRQSGTPAHSAQGVTAANPFIYSVVLPRPIAVSRFDSYFLKVTSPAPVFSAPNSEPFTEYKVTDWTIQYKDLTTGVWTVVDTVVANNYLWRQTTIAPVTAREFRVVFTGAIDTWTGDKYVRLEEFEIRGKVPFRILTPSALPGGAVGLPYSATIGVETSRGSISIQSFANLPAGLALAVSGKSIVVSGTPTIGGNYFDFIVYLNDGSEIITKTFSIQIKDAPSSVWSKRQSVPLAALEAWHALDGATTGVEVSDFSRKNRYLAADANAPALVQSVINGKPGIYFDGTKNPLKYAGNVLFRHAFIVASYDGVTFAGSEGLFSDISSNPILLGNAGTDKFLNLSLSQYGEYVYSLNYVAYPEAGQIAPVTNKIAIIEVKFPPSLFLNGIQFGQDRGLTGRKWKGYFIESLLYSEVKNDCERRQIYEYFAQKFHLWRQTPFGLNIFPFPNNHKTPGSSFVNELSSTSISGAQKTRSKSGLIRRFDVPYAARYQSEFEAAEAFWYQNRRRCVFEDNAVYPPRAYTGRITTPIDRDPQLINNFDYKFGFETSGGLLPGGEGFNAAAGLDFIYE